MTYAAGKLQTLGSAMAAESAAATASPFSQQVSGLFGAAANAAQAEPPPGIALANIVDIGLGNWDSASSDLIGMAGGGLLPAANETGEISAVTPAPVDEMVLTGAMAPVAPRRSGRPSRGARPGPGDPARLGRGRGRRRPQAR